MVRGKIKVYGDLGIETNMQEKLGLTDEDDQKIRDVIKEFVKECRFSKGQFSFILLLKKLWETNVFKNDNERLFAIFQASRTATKMELLE